MASSSSAPETVARRATPRRAHAWWLLGVVAIGLAWHIGSLQRDALLGQLEAEGRQALDLYVSHLGGQLDRFAFLPALLADDFRLQSLLIAPNNRDQQDRVNRFLGHVNTSAGALDVYLMDAAGNTLAASNWQDEMTFVGRNFAFRPYFVDAMRGRPGRYFALGTTSNRRGYYFSHPVGDPGEPLGVVVVKIAIDTFERGWRAQGAELVISDPDGVIFISTRPEWRYRTLFPLRAEVRERIRASRRYPVDDLSPVFRVPLPAGQGGALSLTPQDAADPGYLAVLSDMPEAGWQVRLLLPQRVVTPQVWQTRLLALSLFLLVGIALWLYAARSRRQREREQERRQVMEDALVELERRVARRTADLTEANRRLRQEVEEHEQTRDELIQAAKLAALGQMSAGINHELNQPLAAMRTYADNARSFLARGNLDQAAWNLRQISELTGRMAQISGQLKVFSRRASGQRIRVSLGACLDGARRIVRNRLADAGAELVVKLPPADLFVAADMVQLEQILVNLIGNACDALHDQPRRQITVSAHGDGEVVRIAVHDSGPGIAPEHLARVFDPFFTTSDGGLGLGLSISHTIAQRLGGDLAVANTDRGGAVFTLTLLAWDDATMAPSSEQGAREARPA